ncbi:MAG TPA: AAA-like domain-containing protein [Chthoniobacteraceae bacterium]|jgi:class 3 adenylate cyclase|nr:hypothetical protein [Chthoniobacter sp.]HEV7869583.1 AAA-like domain-containing protein [Chthoniobacteraceae bacterium]
MAHVLFADVVGYSKLATDAQPRLQQRLWQLVRASQEFTRAKGDGGLICLPTGDGLAMVFPGHNVCGPLRTALEIANALKASPDFGLRIGLHSGPVYRLLDINGSEGAAGAGLNLAQRVMDCGDAGHILLSAVQAGFIREFGAWKGRLHDLGLVEVKHGEKLHLFSYSDGEAGNATLPQKVAGSSARPEMEPRPSCVGTRVALIYKRHAEPDETLLAALEAELTAAGCSIFVDRHLRVGLDWAREIENEIRKADAVIPLLSPAAEGSEMLEDELRTAYQAAQQQGGRPRLLPVRVNWEGPLRKELAALLDPIHYLLWRGPEDTTKVVAQLLEALAQPPVEPERRPRQLETPGGAMPLDSQFYLERPSDVELHAAIARRESFVLLEGARQMGKTSLLARGLQRARSAGAKVACIDFQTLNLSDLATLESLYLTLGTTLANQLDLERFPEEVWRPKAGPNQNFERYLTREVLGKIPGPLVWGLDEVDRLFTCPFGSEVFGLFRSWHNARALQPDSPWHRFTQIICYATEVHLFITDLNQSPFNVGTRIPLRDFSLEEVRTMNARYGSPLRDDAELLRFQGLLGGQPYLVRRGLHELASERATLAQLEQSGATEEGPFADHLKRYLVLLSRDAVLLQGVRDTLATGKSPEARDFYRLRAAGLLRGVMPQQAEFRCDIYACYLKRHLNA